MINGEEQYLQLMSGILYGGKEKESRAGDTISVFGRQWKHDMRAGFPLLTTKKVYWKHAVTELLWILQGRTDLAYLHEHGLKYWDPDYNRSGRTDMDLGPVYGKQLRSFNGTDQLKQLLIDIKQNPSSRRLMASLWNPSDMADAVLPPCHYGFQVYINDGVIDLMWNQRSVDVFLGLPYDIAMYGLLLYMLAKGNGLKPGQLIANLGDCHLYANHKEQAKEQLSREQLKLPSVDVMFGLSYIGGTTNSIVMDTHETIKLIGYESHAAIKAPLSVG